MNIEIGGVRVDLRAGFSMKDMDGKYDDQVLFIEVVNSSSCLGVSDQVMNSHFGHEMHGFCVANLGNGSLFPAICVLKPHLSDANLLRPCLIRGSFIFSDNRSRSHTQ